MFNVLVLEENKELNKNITEFLQKNGYTMLSTYNTNEALEMIDKHYLNIIVNDIKMSNEDGFNLLRNLKEAKIHIPTIIITDKEQIKEKEKGFTLGADGYIDNPLILEELLIRIKTLLRIEKDTNEQRLVIGDVVIDYNQRTLKKGKKDYYLTKKEIYLLFKLLSNPNTTFNRYELFEEIWGMESESDFRTVDVHIKRIREKTKDINEFKIVSVRGIGYKAIINEKINNHKKDTF